jgi:hypothetical protein
MNERVPIRFFLLTFTWSWVIWAPLVLAGLGVTHLQEDLVARLALSAAMLGAFGPAFGVVPGLVAHDGVLRRRPGRGRMAGLHPRASRDPVRPLGWGTSCWGSCGRSGTSPCGSSPARRRSTCRSWPSPSRTSARPSSPECRRRREAGPSRAWWRTARPTPSSRSSPPSCWTRTPCRHGGGSTRRCSSSSALCSCSV